MTQQKLTHQTANSIKEFFKRWPRFYYFVFDFLGPVYFGGLGPRQFLQRYASEGICLNLGSGARKFGSNVINVDITPYGGVDVVADITKLPHPDESVNHIVCDQALEHVQNPELVVAEIFRVLQSGGFAYISTPFMYAFHASPSDYQRFTVEGLKKILNNFEVVEIGTRSGPFSTLTVYLCYLTATLFSFGNERLYWTLALVSTLIFFPIKYLDVIGNRLPFSKNMAAVLYCVVRKV
jgi:SAM-dependent methyltransferase